VKSAPPLLQAERREVFLSVQPY